jgi:glycerol-3-phosphate dehydrogenase (NAD(P)+)
LGEFKASSHVAVLGAGSWGTALAIQIARAGHGACLWGRDPEQLAAMASKRENDRFLPGASFPDTLCLEANLQAAVESADIVLLCVPSHAFPDLLQQVTAFMRPGTRAAWASKGFEPGSGRFLHEVVEDAIGAQSPGAVITGPSFAREVADDVPTAVTVASRDLDFAEHLAGLLHFGNFRTYTTDDIVGAELGGAVKNVLAVGTGIADGMGLGANTRAALITRGLAEMMRLSQALGARP